MAQWPNTSEQQWGTHRDAGGIRGPGWAGACLPPDEISASHPSCQIGRICGPHGPLESGTGAWDGETPPLGPLPLSADQPCAGTPRSSGLSPSFLQAASFQQPSGWHGDHTCTAHHPSINNAAGELRPQHSPRPSPTCLLISITVAVACQGSLRLRGTLWVKLPF